MRLHIKVAVGPVLIEIGSDDTGVEDDTLPDRFALNSDVVHGGYVDPALTATPIPSVTYADDE